MRLDSPAVGGRGRLLGAAALLIGLVPFALHATTVLSGYFWQDDFAIIQRAAAAVPYDPAYLFQDYNGHLAPGVFLLAWLATAISPLNHTVAVLPVLAMHAGALLAFWRLLVVCFGARRAVLVPFAAFAFSPIVLFSTLWWAFAVQMVPVLLTMAAALDCHVRHLRTGRRGYAIGAVLWLVAGLAFYEKAILVPALLFAVTALLAPSGAEALSWAWREHRKLWFGYGALIACYALVYLILVSVPPALGTPTMDTAEFVRRAVVDTLLPGLFGGPWPGDAVGMTWADPAAAVRVAVGLAAVAVVAGGIARSRRRAVLAWAALGGYLAVDLVLVATARLPQFGVLIGSDPRFLADAVPVAVLMGAFAYLPPGERAERGRRAVVPAAALTALTALFAVSATVAALSLATAVPFTAARDYVANVRSALQARPDLPVFDSHVPNDMMVTWGFGHDARVSRLTALLPVRARFDQPAETLHMFDTTGTPRPVEGVLAPVAAEPGPVAGCGWAVTGELTAVPLTEAVSGKLVVLIGYYTADAGEVSVSVAGAEQLVRVEAGVHRLSLVVDGAFSRIDLRRTTPAAAVCVDTVQVGHPWVEPAP
ncbi:hypothetical protein ACTG9Q_10265 [Actinokineospora sp. 24-640]